MPLIPSQITDEVRDVLLSAQTGDWDRPNFLTAYQILERLPPRIRDALIEERTMGGRGSGVHYSAISVVAQAAELLPGVVKEYLDTLGLTASVAGKHLSPGYEVCAIYRLENATESV